MSGKKVIRIVVLEDNTFYNRIFSEKLKLYLEGLKESKDFNFEIESYTHAGDCIANLKFDTDIAFIDYYLDDNKNALNVIRKIKWRCPECKIIILSQFYSITNSILAVLEGASEFIQKGISAIPKSCYIAEDIISKRIASV